MGTNYNNYLKSEWWKGLRTQRLRHNKRCEACGKNENLQIHHFNYKFKYSGDAKKATKHTKVLCSRCHQAFHRNYGVKKDMTAEMKEFIKDARDNIKVAREQWKEIYAKEEWLRTL